MSEKPDLSSEERDAKKPRKQIRVWADGCFDMMHYGHSNALRKAKELGDYLVVGVHSDADILLHKGPPVMNEQERYAAVRACKWVDEVVEGAPYVTQLAILNEHNIDFCVHGDDIVTAADGTNTYQQVIDAGKFRTVPRTVGVSTTDLVGRMLLMTKSHHQDDEQPVDTKAITDVISLQPNTFKKYVSSLELSNIIKLSTGSAKSSPYTKASKFVATARQLVQFAEGKEPKDTDKIVYVDGGFDLFHIGHIMMLEQAKKMGDYLIVGVHSDKVVNEIRGENLPIMNVHERTLSVLSCRYVDEVIIGAPYSVSAELIDQQRISVVVHGSEASIAPDVDGKDPYAIPKERGIFKVIESPCKLTTNQVIERIIKNRQQFLERNRKKEAKEVAMLEK